MLCHGIQRRTKAAVHRAVLLWAAIVYRIQRWRFGVDERWVRRAFSAVAQMDVGEWLRLPPPHTAIWFKAWGNEVHIREYWGNQHQTIVEAESYGRPDYECVIKEGLRGVVYVDEWRKKTREVILEYGSRHKTNWWEVFRTGRRLESVRFIEYLKVLYGNGGDDAVQKQSSAGVHVRDASADGAPVGA